MIAAHARPAVCGIVYLMFAISVEGGPVQLRRVAVCGLERIRELVVLEAHKQVAALMLARQGHLRQSKSSFIYVR